MLSDGGVLIWFRQILVSYAFLYYVQYSDFLNKAYSKQGYL